MKAHSPLRRNGIRHPAYRAVFQRLDEALARTRQRDRAFDNLLEDERINRARLALFGFAPK